MKTLIIHPKCISNTFLEAIYKNKPHSIIESTISVKKVKRCIGDNDRIILLGSGTEKGLICSGKYIIDKSFADLLKQKEVIAIWNGASKFINTHKIKSILYSDLLILNRGDALQNNISTHHLTESIVELVNCLRIAIHSENPIKTLKDIFISYPNKAICDFNLNNFYSHNSDNVFKILQKNFLPHLFKEYSYN